ncbi:hypothetical protein [Propionivibrio sp.]|uniref:hypothetical protein n=1 Tax=Propionivibrio sp. TaxID=2212460 RepID=UPI0025F6DF18|nr:hypothetical protein [Propionivibrio sp.]MBK8745707.1 hypothetical protein [Propionivibrio sp.]
MQRRECDAIRDFVFFFGGTLVDAPTHSCPAIIIPRGTLAPVQNTTRPPNIGGIRI